MLTTLHTYIFREMGKNYLLTAVGLTGVMSTCGGVYNLTQLENVTPEQTAILLGLAIPMFAAFSLPIAALFSATITYGRMAADHEFVACRSSGINLYTLLMPCLAISVISGVITFVFFNFVIPGFMNQIRILSRASIKAVAAEKLRSGSTDEFEGFRIYADRVSSPAIPDPDTDALLLEGVAFIETRDDQISSIGTGSSAAIKFDLNLEYPQLEADIVDIQVINLEDPSTPETGRLTLGPYLVRSPLRVRPSRLSLPELIRVRHHPEEVFRKVRQKLQETRRAVLAALLFNYLDEALAGGAEISLSSPNFQYQVRCAKSRIHLNPEDDEHWLELSDVRVSSRQEPEYAASGARILLDIAEDRRGVMIELISDVTVQAPGEPGKETKSRKLGPLELPAEVLAEYQSPRFSKPAIWNLDQEYHLGAHIEQLRKKLYKDRTKRLHEVHSEIHIRTVYSLSVVFLAVLGAALAIIFKGGQLLVSFGISFLPTIGFVFLTILGKSIAKNVGLLIPGLSVMWAAVVLVFVLDIVVLRKYLPR